MTANFVFEYSGLKVSEMFCSVDLPLRVTELIIARDVNHTSRRMNELKMTYIYSPEFLIEV